MMDCVNQFHCDFVVYCPASMIQYMKIDIEPLNCPSCICIKHWDVKSVTATPSTAWQVSTWQFCTTLQYDTRWQLCKMHWWWGHKITLSAVHRSYKENLVNVCWQHWQCITLIRVLCWCAVKNLHTHSLSATTVISTASVSHMSTSVSHTTFLYSSLLYLLSTVCVDNVTTVCICMQLWPQVDH